MKKLIIFLTIVFIYSIFTINVDAMVLNTNLNTADIQDEAFETSLAGFDESYKPYLRYLHTIHPNWKFVPMNTNLDFETSYLAEKAVSSIEISTGNCEQNPYHITESGWCIANEETTKFYLDPRNFLSEKYIFMFQRLNNDDKFEESVVQGVLNGNSLMEGVSLLDGGQSYASIFVEAGTYANVSPVYLATLAIQEIGSGGINTSGEEFEYKGFNYSGLYNFFNIGAYSGEDNPTKAGLVFANGGTSGSETSYGRPWTSPKLAIKGGASFIAKGYIASTQYTIYLKKFNVNPDSKYIYNYQYQANLAAPSSESAKMYNSLKKSDLLDKPYTFVIPQYNNMPNGSIISSNNDSENNVNSSEEFLSILNARVTGGYLRGYAIGTTIGSIKNTVGDKATIVIKDSSDNILSDDSIIRTGCKISISNGADTKTYEYVLYGDLTGDGEINSADLLLLRKHLIGTNALSGVYRSSAYIDSDSAINSADLLRLRQHLLGTYNIGQ